MADIRDFDTAPVSHRTYRDLEAGRTTSSQKEEAEANKLANASKKWGIRIFGRLHNQQWDDKDIAQATADQIGGELVELI